MEIKVNVLDSDLRQTNITMSEYQQSIDTYSNLCDGIMRDKESNDSVFDDLRRRVANIEHEQLVFSPVRSKKVRKYSDRLTI